MTQGNNAADRAQYINDASEETTAANEAFAQDWLDAEEKERAEQTSVPSRSRLVATLPEWATLSETSDERKSVGGWRAALRNGKLRTSGVAVAAFGLGFLCAAGSWRGETTGKNVDEVATVAEESEEKGGESFVAFENELGVVGSAAFASIDSSTLRSVPNSAGVDFISQAQGDAGAAANGGGAANVNDWANGAAVPTASEGDDSSWRRGVDFQRELTAPADATANVDRFPTWNELGANFPTVDDVLNAPVEAVAQNSPIGAETGLETGAGYAVYNENADYQGGNAANLNGAAPQFAGNSQNSGYNQANGSENFAGWPTTSTPAANFASTAPTPATNFASTAPTPAANFASTASTPAANFASTAPTPAANYTSVAPSSTAGFATEAPRAMVAQIPSETVPAPASNVPATNPNLRW